MANCKNCEHPITENFCPACGQPAKIKRIDWHYIQHEIAHVLHFEKGVLYTIKALLIKPGQSIREFISGDRNRLVKPIIFIIVSSLIYTIISHFFGLEDGYISFDEEEKSTTGVIFEWVQNHYGYANIIMGVFIGLWLKVFFRKYDYNIFEILILLCFVMGIGMLQFSVFSILEGLTKLKFMSASGIIFLAYSSWAVGQFFDKKKIASYLKAFAAYHVRYDYVYVLRDAFRFFGRFDFQALSSSKKNRVRTFYIKSDSNENTKIRSIVGTSIPCISLFCIRF